MLGKSLTVEIGLYAFDSLGSRRDPDAIAAAGHVAPYVFT
jgi:hypothetical protein